jgi:acyl-CoA synthetase (AMP-forming)/AMP-acid ligase II
MTEVSAAPSTLTDLLIDGARHGDRPCFVCVAADTSRITSTLTFAEAVEQGKRVAATLTAAGLAPGGRVLLAGQASSAWVATFFGTTFAGGVTVPVNHRFRSRELSLALKTFEPSIVAADATTIADAREAIEASGSDARLIDLDDDGLTAADAIAPVQPDPEGLALILQTSGTTGIPKGVERTHEELATFSQRWTEYMMQSDDRIMNFLPLYHQAGLLTSFLGAYAGGLPTFHIDRFDRSTFWTTVDTHDLTWAILMQPVTRYLVEDAAGAPPSSHALRWAISTQHPDDWAGFQSQFGVSIQGTYGSTETTIAWVTGSRDAPATDLPRVHGPLGGALCGQRVDGWAEIRLVSEGGEPIEGPNEPGFIEVRGGTLFKRYFRNPKATADAFDEDGWFRSEDFGYLSPAGDLYFLNRVSGLIRRSGENIAPREIEELLEEHPAVAEAAVIGVHDDLRGQEVAAFVVPREGMPFTEADVLEYCEQRLARFKIPRYVEFRSELPHTATFKVRLDQLQLSPAAVDRSARDRLDRS